MCQCHYCDYTTTSSGDLKAHSRKHAGEMLLCQHCDYSSACSSALKRHSCKHTGETIQCQYCHYQPTQYRSLLIFTGEIFFLCEHCDFSIAYSNSLKEYLRKHTGEILQCQHCDISTAYSSALKRHSRKHTGNINF